MDELAFVISPRQNYFFRELVEAIREELERAGISSTVSATFPAPRRGLAYALVPPHEYFRLEGWPDEAATTLLDRTVFLCAEQPGTSFFEDDVRLSAHAHAVFDVNRTSVSELRRRGIDASHFQVGAAPSWSHFSANEERDVDVVFLGCDSERRSRHLAAYADSLWRWRSAIVISDNSRPNTGASATFVTGEEKWRLLGRSRIMLNLHQGDAPYFEWLRVVQAILNGCVVVSEHSSDHDPLRAGEHFLSGRPETLMLLAQRALEDSELLGRLRADALSFLEREVPLRAAALDLASAAADAAGKPLRHHATAASKARPTSPPEEPAASAAPVEPTTEPHLDVVRRVLKEVALDLLELRRVVARERAERVAGRALPPVEPVLASPTYASARPRVSVLVSLHNYAAWVAKALSSVAESRFRSVELVIVDDGSTDDSPRRARAWLEENWRVPALLVSHPVNRGLPHARNTALGFARGELSFVLDADNQIYPHGLGRLVDALDADSTAAFAYGMLQHSFAGRAVALGNTWPWDPGRLRRGNYVDAMAMVRTDVLRRAGGYSTDRALHGWEDYELWCRMARDGERGVFVREIVGRYRKSPNSMLGLTNVSTTIAQAVLSERYPEIFAGEGSLEPDHSLA